MDEMLRLLRDDSEDEISMLAELRETFLDIEKISKEEGHDILGEVVSCPKHVIYYAAKYIESLKEESIK